MLRSVGLTHTHMECRYLKETVPVLTDLLAFEKVSEHPGEATFEHPNTKYCVVCAVRPDFKDFSPNFRFTISLESKQAVDEAYRWFAATGQELGIAQLCEPAGDGSSFLLAGPDRNWWEIAAAN